MRRPILAMSIFASLAGVACEDGPNDPYRAAPAGAGGVWNAGSDGGAYSSDAGQGYNSSSGGSTAIDICTADEIKKARDTFFPAPIQPPGLGGGMDVAGGPLGDGKSGWNPLNPAWKYDGSKESWTGMTIEMAQTKNLLCQGSNVEVFVGISGMAWGDQDEINAVYSQDNRKISELVFRNGYLGTLDFDSDPTGPYGNKHYSLVLKNIEPMQVTDKSKPGSAASDFLFTWNPVGGGTPGTVSHAINEVWDGLRYTYSRGTPRTPDCLASGQCASRQNDGQNGKWSFPYLGLYIYIDAWQAAGSFPNAWNMVRLDLLKILPFSDGAVTMQFDNTGPYLSRKGLGDAGDKECKFTFGMTYKDFLAKCVAVSSDAAVNATNVKKLDGGRTHSDENFHIDIAGIDPQFTATLKDSEIVGETTKPQDGDTAFSLTIDQSTIGAVANDWKDNDVGTGVKDLHGIGLITLETANLIQKYMKTQHPALVTKDLGNAACAADPTSGGCSGLEGVLTSAPPAAVSTDFPAMKINAVGTAAKSAGSNIGVGMKPGTWFSYFCADGNGLDAAGKLSGYKDCVGGGSNYFKAFQEQMAAAVGGVANLPKDVQSLRWVFKQFVLASVKYFKATGQYGAYPTLKQIDAQTVSLDDLFFDSEGNGYEDAKYVDRSFVDSANQDPTVMTVAVMLTAGTVDRWDFTRHNYRGEKALYTVFDENPATTHPGAEPVLLSNMVGSPALVNSYPSYECAIDVNGTNTDCAGVIAPKDELGEPLYKNYKGAFGTSIFNLPPAGGSQSPVPITVDDSMYTKLGSATASIPVWRNPYGGIPSAPADVLSTYKVLLPYLPMGSGVGFPVTIDGSRDGFINTYSLDFTGGAGGFLGGSISANLDYGFAYDVDPKTGAKTVTGMLVKAIETTDYLGMVFMCSETDAAGNPDILGVRMYEQAQNIYDYLAKYPSAKTDCDIVIKYSPYGNYADYITSRTYGVRLGLNAGSGGSVVTDVLVYDPNVASYLQSN
jgi:hypothetical protein